MSHDTSSPELISGEQPGGGVKRREFLKVLGVTGAGAAAIGCASERVEKLIPYLVSPDETVPGVSTYYATTCRECAAACGVIAETRDGRTIKLEGNPAHPLNRGAICSRGQAALQGLYNPDRFRGPMIRQGGALRRASWDDALDVFAQRLAEVRGRGRARDAVFVNRHESGSFPAFLDAWLARLGMPPHISFDPGVDHAAIAANRQTYGVAWPRYDFRAARLIVSLNADFLDTWGPMVPQNLDFADARARLEAAPRFVYIGPRRSLTGLNADQWINARAGSELAIARMLAGQTTPQEAARAAGVDAGVFVRLMRELDTATPSVILGTGCGPDALEVCATVNAANQRRGNVGATVKPAEAFMGYEGIDPPAQLRALAQRMQAGAVSILMTRNVNPAFTLGRNSGFAAALARVPFRVSFSSYPDETTAAADLILPDHHPLEQWGDAQPVRGTLSLQQPTMDPVFDTRATADVLLSVQRPPGGIAAPGAGGAGATAMGTPGSSTRPGAPAPGAAAPIGGPAGTAAEAAPEMRTWLIVRMPGGAAGLAAALPRGIVAGTPAPRSSRAPAVVPAGRPSAAASGDMHLLVYHHPVLGSGEGANKPWLQELPDPVTKITWQTVVEMHPEAARRLGVENGDHVSVTTSAGSITAPVYVYQGVRPDTIAIAAGRGHAPVAGRYARCGVNAYQLLPYAENAAGGMVSAVAGVRVAKAGAHSRLATTEGSARQHGRGIGQAMLVTELGTAQHATVQAPGAEHAADIAPQGGTESPVERQRATGGEAHGTAAAAGGAAGEHGGQPAAGTHGVAVPGDAPHEYLPGLRSPVAADAQGDLADPKSRDKGMYDPNHWSGMAKRRWAMTIDLARCTGCSACVTACYAENNIPTVGADWQGPRVLPDRTGFGANITRSREMAWLRIERYLEGAEDGGPDFDTRFVPMLCQHCGNAPCEPVCPVYATYHAPDGLNVQVYNRCVGTRYCSNNCPYKVRYFNWFGYGEPDRTQYAFPDPLHWQLNPDVTVRAKGVMEKCTFCVQRIREAENRAKLERRPVQPDEFTTACAEACPSRAITFGDAADDGWTVARLVKDRRAYHVFEELNTYTAIAYLKKVIHPAPGSPAPAAAPEGQH